MRCFCVASPGPTWRHVAATLAQTTLFWGVFLGLLPWGIHSGARWLATGQWPFPGHAALGLVVFVLASALGLTSGLCMAVRGRGTPLPLATARELVVVGPYRHVRNPMALAGIAQGVGVGLWLGDAWVVGYAITGAVLWHVAVRPSEERDLLQRFGEPYRRYHAAVPLWWPRWRGCAAIDA